MQVKNDNSSSHRRVTPLAEISGKRKFTLIELLVVIAIIAILAALLFRPCGQRRKKQPRLPAPARFTSCI